MGLLSRREEAGFIYYLEPGYEETGQILTFISAEQAIMAVNNSWWLSRDTVLVMAF